MLKTDIQKLIETEDFFHHFQNLYDINNWTKIGSEVFLRSKAGKPKSIFCAAKIADRLYDLEIKSLIKALKFYYPLYMKTKFLFINISLSTILHTEFPNIIKMLTTQFPNMKYKIVFEINKLEDNKNITLFKERINLIKKSGYFFAIGVGTNWNSLETIVELKPNFIKLERFLAMDLARSHLKQEMIKSLLYYAQKSNFKVILEGIEQDIDLAIAKYLGIDICQGFLLDKPHPLCYSST
jgi:EAL domain-containing protein (putative c-di-GMP-specific phosphodiesterase class I)